MAGERYPEENILFTDLRSPEKAEGCENNPLYQYATFWVEDVNDYEEVKDRMKEVVICWQRYDLLDNTGMSDTMADNFNDLSKISSLILVFVMMSAILILLFVFLFWMKNRIRELGVLMSIGRGKGTIILQILMEGLLIGAVAFVLATFSASSISEGVAEYLVGYQVQMADEESKSEEGMVMMSSPEEKENVLGVTVNIGKEVIVFSALSTLGIIIVSILISSIYVVLQKPKNILSQMS